MAIVQLSPTVSIGTLAERPAAAGSPVNAVFYATDTGQMYFLTLDVTTQLRAWVAAGQPAPTGATGGAVQGLLKFAGTVDDNVNQTNYLADAIGAAGAAQVGYVFAVQKTVRNFTFNLLSNPSGVVHTVSLLDNGVALLTNANVGPATGVTSLAGPATLAAGHKLDVSVRPNTNAAGTSQWSATVELFG